LVARLDHPVAHQVVEVPAHGGRRPGEVIGELGSRGRTALENEAGHLVTRGRFLRACARGPVDRYAIDVCTIDVCEPDFHNASVPLLTRTVQQR